MNKKWKVVGKKVQGSSHKRKNIVCQDSYMTHVEEGAIILTVADGHGSGKYFRSDVGSNLACLAAIDISKQYIKNIFSKENTSVIKDICNNKFKSDVIRQWHKNVVFDLSICPLNEDEFRGLNVLKENYDNIISSKNYIPSEDNKDDFYKILKPYGSTLLISIIMKDFILLWQLGDGDILFYYKDKGVVKPVPDDERLIANETTSICGKDAVNDMRFVCKYLYDEKNEPDLIMVTTDGYSNSFANYEDFKKVSVDYYDMLKKDSMEVYKNLEGWLLETSNEGSGDDISVVLAWKK